ncbi:MAG: hypothetical protein IT438_11185 [Phycisphaerales bacterium]|nr:hypothetical protein [Phycisphaerales bacterium]
MRVSPAILPLIAALAGGAVSPLASAHGQPAGSRATSKGPDLLKPALEAEKLAKAGKVEDATKKFESIWNDLRKRDSMFSRPDTPMILDLLRAQCARSRSLRDKLRTIRDQSADSFDARGKQLSDLAAWIVLNRIVDQETKTLDWWTKVRKSPLAADVLTRFRPWLEPMLARHDRLADLALLIDDPAAHVRREYAGFRAALRQDSSDLNHRVARDVFLTRHARSYTSLLLAGRDRDALRLATEAMTLDHSPQMVACMVKAAIDCGKASRQHLDWINALESRNDQSLAQLKSQVEELVARPPQPAPATPDAPRKEHANPITTAAAPALPNITLIEPPESP